MPFVLSASASLGFQNTGVHSNGALTLPPGTAHLNLSYNCIPLASSMAPSVRYPADLSLPRKRLCNATSGGKGSGSKNFVSNCVLSSPDSNRKAPTYFRDSSCKLVVTEFERPSIDGLRKLDLSPELPERLKSAKELHFEAVESYCPNYDDEYYNNNIVGLKSPVTCLGDVEPLDTLVEQDNDAVGAPQNTPDHHLDSGIKYIDVCEGDFLSQDYANTPSERVYKIDRATGTNHENSTIVRKKRKDTLDSVTGPCKVTTRKTVQANQEIPVFHRSSTESSTKEVTQCSDQSQNRKDFQQNMHQIEDGGSEKDLEDATLEAIGDLSKEQRIRMEINKAAALARRNMRICEDNTAEAQAHGLPFPKFKSLLVEKSWLEVLRLEFQKPYMERLQSFVSQEAAGKVPIYPPPAKLLNAFNSCPFNKVKVVIIGQDPYHGPGQAMGLCFSVEMGVKLPSSLANIFTEIVSDLQIDFPSHGNLERWAHQGVLLLNTVLTVRDHHANSHAKRGWELFTDAAIRALAQQRSGLVFLLWGNQAQDKIRLINKTSHHVLKAFHPSGISAHRGFFKCRHFSKTNQILQDQGLLPIDWQV